MTMTPKKMRILKNIKPKSLNSTSEALLKETPKKKTDNEETKTETLNVEDEQKRTEENDFENLLDDMEEKLSNRQTPADKEKDETESNEFAFNPDISFPNIDRGNSVIDTSKCPTDCLVTCGRQYHGLRPARNGHAASVFTITGKPTSHVNKFSMFILCNLLLFLYRLNQDQIAMLKTTNRCLDQPPITVLKRCRTY